MNIILLSFQLGRRRPAPGRDQLGVALSGICLPLFISFIRNIWNKLQQCDRKIADGPSRYCEGVSKESPRTGCAGNAVPYYTEAKYYCAIVASDNVNNKDFASLP